MRETLPQEKNVDTEFSLPKFWCQVANGHPISGECRYIARNLHLGEGYVGNVGAQPTAPAGRWGLGQSPQPRRLEASAYFDNR